MIDPSTFAGTLAANVATQHVSKVVNQAIDEHPARSIEEILSSLEHIAALTYTHLRNNTYDEADLFKLVTMYKNGFGVAFTPVHNGTRQYYKIFTPVQALLNVTNTPLGNYNYTVPVGWSSFDFPEGSTYTLDTTMTNNSMSFWLRETNQN